jgi:hypothetical protein
MAARRRRRQTTPIAYDYLFALCNTCGHERYFPLEPLVFGRQELTTWLETKLSPCPCGSVSCRIRTHAVESPIAYETAVEA